MTSTTGTDASIVAARKAALAEADRFVSGELKAGEAAQSRTLRAAHATAEAIEAGWITTLEKADKAKIDEILIRNGWDGESQQPSAEVRKAAQSEIRKAVATMAHIDQATWGYVNGVSKAMVSQWRTMATAVAVGVTPDADADLWTALTSGAMVQTPKVRQAVLAEDATPEKVAEAVEKVRAEKAAKAEAEKAKRQARGHDVIDRSLSVAKQISALVAEARAVLSGDKVTDANVTALENQMAGLIAEVRAARAQAA